MTDLNSTLLGRHPFVNHCAYTLWRLEQNPAGPDKKPVKVPVHYDGHTRHSLGRPARRGKPAVAPNPAPPMNAEQAIAWLKHHRASGLGHDRAGEIGYIDAGFRPSGTGLVCVDLDDCVRDGKWTPGAEALMARFPGALIELSVSGRGAHIWMTVSGEGPGRLGKKLTPLGEIEVYADGQFIAQGRVLGGDARVDHTAAVQALVGEFWPKRSDTTTRPSRSEWDDLAADEQARVLAEIRSTFPHLKQDTYEDWVAIGMALTSLGDDLGLELWHEVSEQWPGYDFDACELKWWDLEASRTSYQALFVKAKEANNGWENPRARKPLGDAGDVFETTAVDATTGVTLGGPLPAGAVLERPANVPDPEHTLSFMAAAQGQIPATVASVETGLLSPEAGVKLAFDVFKDRLSISLHGSDWRPFRDTDYGRLRAAFERGGFKAVPVEAMKTAVAMVAEKNQFDSAHLWASALVWDGNSRLDSAFIRYFGCDDTPYTRALGPYMFTTLGGRALVPGEKADMAIIMVGMQGVRKTSALEALVPEPDAFGEVDLAQDDEKIARRLRGKMVVELAEMRGFHGRDADANKAWVSRRKEEFRPLYSEFTTTYWRRCLLIGTANDMEQLDDPTGARRFLPVRVGHVDIEALRADRDQLWAEGVARFRVSGIAWEEAERLAKAEHHKFEVVDELQSKLLGWLEAPPTPVPGQPIVNTPRSSGPIHGHEILRDALGMTYGQIKKADEMRLAKNMKRLGYERITTWQHGKAVKLWRKV